jgi:DNA-binding NarL/FixJ family response regulator
MLSERFGRRYRENSVFFRADFARRKPYYTGVKKSPRAIGDPTDAVSKWDLTRREVEVLELLRTGASDKEIANSLGVSRLTASKHVENILKKMNATNRTAAACLSWRDRTENNRKST